MTGGLIIMKTLFSLLILLLAVLFFNCSDDKDKDKKKDIIKVSEETTDTKKPKPKPEPKEKDIAKIGNMNGKIEYLKNEKLSKWNRARPSQLLHENNLIKTDEASSCNININDENNFYLGEKTTIKVENAIEDVKASLKNITLEHKIGTIVGKLSLKKGDTVSIKTPSAVVGIRGTTFSINTTDKGTKIAVKKGTISVKRNIDVKGIEPGVIKKYDKVIHKEYTVSAGQKAVISKKDNDKIKELIIKPGSLPEQVEKAADVKQDKLTKEEIETLDKIVAENTEEKKDVDNKKDDKSKEEEKNKDKKSEDEKKKEEKKEADKQAKADKKKDIKPLPEPKKKAEQKPVQVTKRRRVQKAEPQINVEPFKVVGISSRDELGSHYRKRLSNEVTPGSYYRQDTKKSFGIDIHVGRKTGTFLKDKPKKRMGSPSFKGGM